MKFINNSISFLFILIFQNAFTQDRSLKIKANELGYDQILQVDLFDKYYSYNNDLRGVLDENFNTLLPTQYSLILREGTELLRLKNTAEKYALYNLKEEKMIFENCSWISHALLFSKENKKRQLFEVCQNENESYAIYSKEGQLVTKLPDGYTVSLHGGPSVGVFVLCNSTQTNFLMINDKGEKLAEYPFILQPFEGKDYFMVRKDQLANGETSKKYGLLNHGGEFLYDLKYENIAYDKGFVILRLKNKTTILDADLKPILKSKPGIYAEIVEDRFFLLATPNGLWRLYNLSGSLIMEHKAKKMHYYGQRLFRITTEQNETYFIDISGNKVAHKEE